MPAAVGNFHGDRSFLNSARFSVWMSIFGACLLAGAGERAPRRVVDMAPEDYEVRFLNQRSGGQPGFQQVSPESSGVRFENKLLDRSSEKNRLLDDGSGVAAADVNGDGWVDLYFCGMDVPNRLYLNLGNWTFRDVTEEYGVACANQYSTGALMVDVNGDSRVDLLVAGTGSGVRLFLNENGKTFRAAPDSGLDPRAGSRSLAMADVDQDGDLDLYVCNYRSTSIKDSPMTVKIDRTDGVYSVRGSASQRFTVEVARNGSPVLIEQGEPDQLYLNQGHGHFIPVSWTGGFFLDSGSGGPITETPKDWGLSAGFCDVNRDGFVDLYVCNDFYSPDRLWLGRQGGGFISAPPGSIPVTSWASMSVDFGDVNRDGMWDLYIPDMLDFEHATRQMHQTNFELPEIPAVGWGWGPGLTRDIPAQAMRNTLLLQEKSRGGIFFSEAAHAYGIQASGWTWSSGFCDLDLDGWDDIVVVNGHIRNWMNSDLQSQAARLPVGQKPQYLFRELHHPNQIFLNSGGSGFRECGRQMGFDFDGVSTSFCLADLDGDGDADVVTNNMNAPAGLYRNQCPQPRIKISSLDARWVARNLEIRQTGSSETPHQLKMLRAGGRYLASDSLECFFAAAKGGRYELLIESPDPWTLWRIPDLQADTHVILRNFPDVGRISLPLTAEDPDSATHSWEVLWSSNHSIELEWADESAIEIMNPGKRASRPQSFAVGDLNDDPFPDVILPMCRPGAAPLVYLGTANHTFRSVRLPDIPGEITSIAAVLPLNSGEKLLLGFGYDESVGKMQVSQRLIGPLGIRELPRDQPWMEMDLHPSVVVTADWDRDGDLDLMIGAGGPLHDWPQSRRFLLIENRDGRLIERSDLVHDSAAQVLQGPMTDALWVDLDLDGDEDLVTTHDPGQVLIWWNNPPSFTISPLNLESPSPVTGRFQSIAATDVNGDFYPDLLIGNIGRNQPMNFYADGRYRIQLFPSDSGSLVVESIHNGSGWFPWRGKKDWSAMAPYINTPGPIQLGRKVTYEMFASMSVDQLMQGSNPLADWIVNEYDSILCLNPHSRMKPWVMHECATGSVESISIVAPAGMDAPFQWVMAGNRDSWRAEHGPDIHTGWTTGRFSVASSQVQLWRQGHEAFRSLSSPILFSSSLVDLNRDGQVELLTLTGKGSLHLSRLPQKAQDPGLTVHIQGARKNPQAIGAVCRLLDASGMALYQFSPSSGSYKSPRHLTTYRIPFPQTSAHLEIQWPGAKHPSLIPISTDVQSSRILKISHP